MFKCDNCNYPDEDNRLHLIVKDGVKHEFYINKDGSLEHYDSDGSGQEIYLQCPVCGKKYELESWDLCLEEVYALRKIDNINCRTLPVTIEDLKYKAIK